MPSAHCPGIGTRVCVDFKTGSESAETPRGGVGDLFGTLMLKVGLMIQKTHTEFRQLDRYIPSTVSHYVHHRRSCQRSFGRLLKKIYTVGTSQSNL